MSNNNPLKPLRELDIKDYYKKVIKLVKSMVFKIDEIYVNHNYHTNVKYGKIPVKREESKYYNNLAGNTIEGDELVTVKSILLNSDVYLTRELLSKDFLLKTVLSKYDIEYDTLIEKYPTMYTYIQGCFLDLNIKDLITAKNYSLLYVDKDYLGTRELNLIKDAEYFVSAMFTRWFNRGYIIDELYLPGFLNNVYQGLVVYLLVKKLENVFTHKVDEFHLFNFLNSYKHIAKYLEVFDNETKLWIYGNLRRIKKYIGQNKTLDIILNDVLDRNKYGVGNITLHKRKPEVINENINKFNKEFIKRDYSYIAESANDTFYNIKDTEYNIEEISHILTENKTIPDFYKLNKKLIDLLSGYNTQHESRTKNFILDRPEKIKQYYFNRKTLVFGNIINIIKTNNFSINPFDYLNPYNNTLYKLTAKDIYYLLIHGFTKFEEIKLDKFKFIVEGIFEYPDKESVLKNTWHKDLLDGTLFDFLYPKELTLRYFPNFELVRYWLSHLKDIELRAWYLISNIVDVSLKSDVTLMLNNGFRSIIIDVNRLEVENYLEGRNLINFFPDTKEGLYDIIIDFLEDISGVDLKPEEVIYRMYDDLKQFFAKTTSYSVILLSDFNFKDEVLSNNQKPSINLDYKPFTEIKEGNWSRNNLLPTDMYSTGFYEGKPEYYKSHWESNVTTLVKTDEYFIQHENETLKNSSTPNTIIYSRRFGIEYKLNNDIEYIKNKENIKTGYAYKTIDTSRAEIPENIYELPNPILKEIEANKISIPKAKYTPTKAGVDYTFIPTITNNPNSAVAESLGKYEELKILNKPGWFKPLRDKLSTLTSFTTNFKLARQDELPTRAETKQILNEEGELVTIYETVYPEEYKVQSNDSVATKNDNANYLHNEDNRSDIEKLSIPLLNSTVKTEFLTQQAGITYNLGRYTETLKFKSVMWQEPENDNITITKIPRDKRLTVGKGADNVLITKDSINNEELATVAKKGYMDEYKPTTNSTAITGEDKAKQNKFDKNKVTVSGGEIGNDKVQLGYDADIVNVIKAINVITPYGSFTKEYKIIQEAKPIIKGENTFISIDDRIIKRRSVYENVRFMNEKELSVIEEQNRLFNSMKSYTLPIGYGEEYTPTSKATDITDNEPVKTVTLNPYAGDITPIVDPILNNVVKDDIDNVNTMSETSSLGKYKEETYTTDSKPMITNTDRGPVYNEGKTTSYHYGSRTLNTTNDTDNVNNEDNRSITRTGYGKIYQPTSNSTDMSEPKDSRVQTVDNKENYADVTPVSDPVLNSVNSQDIGNTESSSETSSTSKYQPETYNTGSDHLVTSTDSSPTYTTGATQTYQYGSRDLGTLNNLEEVNSYDLNNTVTKIGYGKIYQIDSNSSDSDDSSVQQTDNNTTSTNTRIIQDPETDSNTDNTSNDESNSVVD